MSKKKKKQNVLFSFYTGHRRKRTDELLLRAPTVIIITIIIVFQERYSQIINRINPRRPRVSCTPDPDRCLSKIRFSFVQKKKK